MLIRITYIIDKEEFVQRIVDIGDEVKAIDLARHHKCIVHRKREYIMPANENSFMIIPGEMMDRAIIKIERIGQNHAFNVMSLEDFRRVSLLEREDDLFPHDDTE